MKHRLEPHADWMGTRAIVTSLAVLLGTALSGCGSDTGEPETAGLTQALTGSVLYVGQLSVQISYWSNS